MRGGCARSTPLSMPQLLLIPTTTRTLQMPCSKVNGQLSCSSAALLIHRSACSICCWCAIVKMEATITADCVGVTRIQGYRRTRHDALSAASKSAASGPGYSGNDARLQASARVCQLFVAPPVLNSCRPTYSLLVASFASNNQGELLLPLPIYVVLRK